MPADPALASLQRWLLNVVVQPGSLEEALSSRETLAEAKRAEDVLLPSRTLSAASRVAIYRRMYPGRMREALASDYPALEHFLGERGFSRLAHEYVQVFPSRSYTLNRLGDHMPEFLRNAAGMKRHEFLAELARLELAVTEVFDAPEAKPLSAARIARVPLEDWERAVLTTIPAFRLLRSLYNVNAYAEAVKRGGRVPKPKREETCVAVYRRDYAVYRQALSRAAHDLLFDLAGGMRLGEAIQRAMARPSRRPQEQQLFRWFREWVSGGVFASLRIVGA